MIIIKLILKLFTLPIIVVLTVVQWIAIFFTSMSAWVFNTLSFIVFMIACLSYVFQTDTSAEIRTMFITAFVLFIVPNIAEWIIVRMVALNLVLRDFLRS